jgi:hypothetical protein
MSAYVWWYIVRYYGPIDDGTKGGVAGNITKKGYVMSQFARFVRPNSTRVLTTVPRGSVYVSAYKSVVPGSTDNSKFVIVALNMGSSPIDQTFTLQNIPSGTATVTPYVSSKTKNCEQQSNIPISGGTFTATLADSSVTTFVGDVVTVVGNVLEVPQTFELFQNYPNPFNPTTQIDYSIPAKSYVTLTVYNLLGQEVATLFDGIRQAGRYSAMFDGFELTSGVYFYRLRSNGLVQAKRLILLK